MTFLFYFCEFSFTFVIFSVLSSILIFLSVLIDSNFWRSLKFDVFKKTSLSINFWSFFFKFDFITPKVSYKFFSLELNDVQSNVYETWFAADPSFERTAAADLRRGLHWLAERFGYYYWALMTFLDGPSPRIDTPPDAHLGVGVTDVLGSIVVLWDNIWLRGTRPIIASCWTSGIPPLKTGP